MGRERERRLLDGLLGAIAEQGGALVLRGEPGVGKTALLEYVAGSVTGLRVLRVRGVESESTLPFAALADLLLPLRVYLGELPDTQRAALEVCLALAEGSAMNLYATCAGTLNLLAAAAEAGPLLALVDDLQWVDPSSRQVLLFVARRLSADRVGIVMTTRPDGGEAGDLAELPSVEVTGLTQAACAELVRHRGLEVESRVLGKLFRWTGGNPLALLEAVAALPPAQAQGLVPVAELPALGHQLERAWMRRLDGLPERTLDALAVVAASRSSSASFLASALAAVGLSPADIDPARDAGLLEVTADAVELRHPLVRPVALRRVSSLARLRAFRALADVSAGDLRVRYLAAATVGTDEAVAAALAEAASDARRRGAFSSAAHAWHRAAELTPDARTRGDRLLYAATDATIGNLPDAARAWTQEAVSAATSPEQRIDAETVSCQVLWWLGEPGRAHRQLVQLAHELRDRDPGRAVALLAEAVLPAILDARFGLAVQLAEQCAEWAARERLPPSMRTSTSLAHTFAVGGRTAEARTHLAVARTLSDSYDAVDNDQLPHVMVGLTCLWLEDLTEAGRLFTKVIDRIRSYGDVTAFAAALNCRSEVEYRAGRWAAAYADATEALSWALESQQAFTIGHSLTRLAWTDAARGDRAACDDRIAELHRRVRPSSLEILECDCWGLRGFAALGHGDHETALTQLTLGWTESQRQGQGNPHRWPHCGDLAEAATRVGDRARAEEVVAWLEERSRTANLLWPAAVAARCRGLLAGDLDEAEAAFAAAEAAHQQLSMPFEHARTLLCLGEVRRRFRRPADARTPLRTAHAMFEALGAVPWARRAASELAAAGGQRPALVTEQTPFHELTPQELQTARAVAAGMNNVEAATALFLSRKTVEAHLTRVYRKLGVRSRTELTRTLVSHGIEDASS